MHDGPRSRRGDSSGSMCPPQVPPDMFFSDSAAVFISFLLTGLRPSH